MFDGRVALECASDGGEATGEILPLGGLVKDNSEADCWDR